MSNQQRKSEYRAKLRNLLHQYTKVLIVGVDNITSTHIQTIRQKIRGKGVLLMGKNTVIRRLILDEFENFHCILPELQGNVGLLFTYGDIKELSRIVLKEIASSEAKAGSIAPCDVIIASGDTNLEPTRTSFFSALNIATKISRGKVHIVRPVLLLKAGEKVESADACLLKSLNIRPFTYGVTLRTIFDDGIVYNPDILNENFDSISLKIENAATRISCLSLAMGYPTFPSIPNSLRGGYNNLLSIINTTSLEFNYTSRMIMTN